MIAAAVLLGCAACTSYKSTAIADCVKGFHNPPGDTSRCVVDAGTATPIASMRPPATAPTTNAHPIPSVETAVNEKVARCTAGSLTTSADGQLMGMAGAMLQYLRLTNRRGAACSVYGLPTDALATRQGRTFPIHVVSGTALNQPEDPGPVVLQPGESAAIALQSDHAAGYDKRTIYDAVSFRIQSVGRLTWRGSFEPDNGFDVGPVVASR